MHMSSNERESEPILTIAVSAYNAANTIVETLDRLKEIKTANVELIVWDGLSTDGTKRIISKYLDVIDVHIEQKDAGVYDAWNQISKIATGKFLWFVNADDIPAKDALVKIVDTIKNEDADIYHFDMIMISEEGMHLFRKPFNGRELRNGMNINHPTVVVRSTIYENEQFDLRYKSSADFDLLCRLSNKYRFSYRPFVTTYMRMGGMSDRPTNVLKILTEDYRIIRENYTRVIAIKFVITIGATKLIKKFIRMVIFRLSPKLQNAYYQKK